MRLVVHGQKAFGEAMLQRLLDRGDLVVAVCSTPTGGNDPLETLARESGLPLYKPQSWRSDEALDLMRSFEADLCLMAYVLLPVSQLVLDAPALGTIQFHPSLLPYHRGPSSINWAIAKGASRTGLTIFWPDEGLDEGPILLQKTCEIGSNETVGDVYFKRLFPMGVDAMLESLDLIKAGVVLKHAQDPAAGSYETWFSKSVAEIPWDRPAADVFNTIRAADPAPGAWTTFRGARVDVFNALRGERAGQPGEVLALSDEGVVIAAGVGSIFARRLRIEPEGKVPAIDIAHRLGLDVGDRFDWSDGSSPLDPRDEAMGNEAG